VFGRTVKKQKHVPDVLCGARPVFRRAHETDASLTGPKGVLACYLNELLVNNEYVASLMRAGCGALDMIHTPGMLTTRRVSEQEVLDAIDKVNKSDPSVQKILNDIRSHSGASKKVKDALKVQ